MIMRSLLLIITTLFITACGANVQASNSTAPIVLEEQASSHTLDAAEEGQLDKPAILIFHATWCQICAEAMPVMSELEETYQNDVAVIHIDIDQAASRSALLHYQISATPTLVLLSAEGNVLASIPGWPGKAAMENTISQLILYQ